MEYQKLSIFKQPLFWSNVVSAVFLGVLAYSIVFGFNNPTEPAGTGSGAIAADAENKIGIGTAVPTTKLEVAGEDASNGDLTIRTAFDGFTEEPYDPNALPTLIFRASRGTLASPSDIYDQNIYTANSNPVGSIEWQGYEGGVYETVAAITGGTDGPGSFNYSPSFSDILGQLSFYTYGFDALDEEGDGEYSLVSRMRINSHGHVSIGFESSNTGRETNAVLGVDGGLMLGDTPQTGQANEGISKLSYFSVPVYEPTVTNFFTLETGFGLPFLAYVQASGNVKAGICSDLTCLNSNYGRSITLDSGASQGTVRAVFHNRGAHDISAYVFYFKNGGIYRAGCGSITCETVLAPISQVASADSSQPFSVTSSIAQIQGDLVSNFVYVDGSALKFSCTSSCGAPVTIDGANIGPSELLFGVDGLPVIAYATPAGLYVAHCAAANCGTTIDKVSIDNGAATDVEMTIGEDGFPMVSAVVGGALKVYHCATLNCSSVDTPLTVAGSGVANGFSMTLGQSGHPIMAYRISGIIYYRRCGAADCSAGGANASVVVADIANTSAPVAVNVKADGLPSVLYRTSGFGGPFRMLNCANQWCVNGWRRN